MLFQVDQAPSHPCPVPFPTTDQCAGIGSTSHKFYFCLTVAYWRRYRTQSRQKILAHSLPLSSRLDCCRRGISQSMPKHIQNIPSARTTIAKRRSESRVHCITCTCPSSKRSTIETSDETAIACTLGLANPSDIAILGRHLPALALRIYSTVQ